VLDDLVARGIRTIDIACPGFPADCLETLEEVAMMLAGRVAARGGELRAIPCLNASSEHVDALAALLRRELQVPA
jgi:ferrochelatase